jgi:hypothetical protein
MLEKLATDIDALIADGRIKTKWSELEDFGLAELIYMLFDNNSENSPAVTAMVENNTVYMHLFEGIMYEHEGDIYTLSRAYIDVEDNVIFATPGGVMFLYETNIIDAEDPRRYCDNE